MENKYEVVEHDIKEKILSGVYKVNDRLPTESELMKTYNVSRYTIRHAIGELENDHYVYRIQGGGMFVDDWQKINDAPLKSKVIGVITTHIADYIFPNIIAGIDRYISNSGYSILISNTQNNPEKERQSLLKMMDSGISGLIVEPTQSALSNINKDIYMKLKDLGIPILFINAHYSDLEIPYIEMNDFEGGRIATDILFDYGHQKILGLFKIDDSQGVHRMNGYINSYRNHSDYSLLSEMIMYQSSDNMHAIFKRIENALLMNENERPTAILCYNDQLAIQVMDLVRSLSLKIPEDISIIGFDNYQLSQYISPKLTTIEHPKEKMGHDAGKMILDIIEEKQDLDNIIYEPELIIRNSVLKK
ncbi:GntR family transcriptional regulator [Companilactobacillus sp. RD055328]|uniref:GntR family transcriptional regulator n=1 Tax=Companilactobacillus sp. RD055328 TaxID=2916634 RepID=UPI001FC7BD5E|nr:GntR family transcriptional regulator [Companilactobacillus sp. RD055328]GKQ42374.1 GntR family transcriptional regulator [Companilactobacillus sp. RD055328]